MSASRRLVLAAVVLALAPALAAADAPGQSGPHARILIDGDDGFTRANGVIGGDGTRERPYTISGPSIRAEEGPGVVIRNTRAHVVLKYVEVSGNKLHDGVRLENAENVTIDTAEITGVRNGVLAVGSELRLRRVSVADVAGAAVEVTGSVFEIDRLRTHDAPTGLYVATAVGRLLDANVSATAHGLNVKHADLHVARTELQAPVAASILTGNLTLVESVVREASSVAVEAQQRGFARVHFTNLGSPLVALHARADATSRVNLTDSFFGWDAAPRVEGNVATDPRLNSPPMARAGTASWSGPRTDGGRSHGDFLGHDLVRLWTSELGAQTPRAGALLAHHGVVYAVDDLGAVVSRRLDGEPTGIVFPAAEPGAVLALSEPARRLYVGTSKGVLAAELPSGELVWRADVGPVAGILAGPFAYPPRNGSAPSVVVTAGSDLVVLGHDGRVDVRLRGSGPLGPPALFGAVAAAATEQGTLHVWDVGSGRELARADVGSNPSTPAVTWDAVWITAGDRLWRLAYPRPDGPSTTQVREAVLFQLSGPASAPAFHGDRMHVLAGTTLHTLDARNGTKLAAVEVPGARPTWLSVVDDRVLVDTVEGPAAVFPGDRVAARFPAAAGPLADAPAYAGALAFLREDGRLVVYGPDVRAPGRVELAADGTRVAWRSSDGEPPAAIAYYVRSSVGRWHPVLVSGASSVDLGLQGLWARARALDAHGNAGPISEAVFLGASRAAPAAEVGFAVDARLVANATGHAAGKVRFWNNGTAQGAVGVTATGGAPPLSGFPVSVAAMHLVPPQGGTLEIPFALRVDPTAPAGRYAGHVNLTVDGRPASVPVEVRWDPEQGPEYRVLFVDDLAWLPNGSATAVLVVGNDGGRAGNVTVVVRTKTLPSETETEARWTVRLEPGRSALREVFAPLGNDTAAKVMAEIESADPEDGTPEDNRDQVEANFTTFQPLPKPDPDGPAEPPVPDTNATGPLEGVSVAPGDFDGWILEETAEDVFVVRVRSNASATLRLDVAETAGLDVEVLDGPQDVGPGGEAVFRVRVAAPSIAQTHQRATVRFDVVDGDGRRAATEASVLVHARVALPGTTTRETALGAAGLVAGAAVAVAVVGRENARWSLFGAMLPLYTRLRRQEVLQHATRERIHALVEGAPGITLSQLGEQLGLAPGVLLHHLHTLEREGYLASRREGRHRRFFPPGAKGAAAAAPLLSVAEQDFLRRVAARPGLTQSELARELGMSRQLVNYHVKALARRGLVVLVEDGRVSRIYLTHANASQG